MTSAHSTISNQGSIEPILFHVTHAKAGSTWLFNIFHDAFPTRIAPRMGADTANIHAKPGDIHSAVFCSYPDFSKIDGADQAKCFFVMRDVRDALISLYFSWRYSHEENPAVLKFRNLLNSMSEDEGILHVFDRQWTAMCAIQSSWVESGMPVYRYEDLFQSEGRMLIQILRDVEFDFDEDHLMKCIEGRWFENQYKRKPGDTDNYSHGRRGSPGGWKEYRSPQLEKFISEKLARHLNKVGYEM